ncbi:unnamed protein product, partial [Protopolystoma xenopodis]
AGILLVHDRRPQEKENLVETLHGHNHTSSVASGHSGSVGSGLTGRPGAGLNAIAMAAADAAGTVVTSAHSRQTSSKKRSKGKKLRGRLTRAAGGRQVSASAASPSPPEPFLYVEADDDEFDVEDASQPEAAIPASGSTSVPGGQSSDSKSVDVKSTAKEELKQSDEANHEPMETDPIPSLTVPTEPLKKDEAKSPETPDKPRDNASCDSDKPHDDKH